MTKFRSVFRTLSNIYGGAFCKNKRAKKNLGNTILNTSLKLSEKHLWRIPVFVLATPRKKLGFGSKLNTDGFYYVISFF